MNKHTLREQMRDLRKRIPENERSIAAYKLLDNLKGLLKGISKVGIYNAVGSEISLVPLIEYLFINKLEIFKPIAFHNSRKLRFESCTQVTDKDLFYPPDYILKKEIKWYNLELIIVPLIAVDKLGYRLGQGGGYYDATMQNRKSALPILCGAGFATQQVENVYPESWDIKLDYFVSENSLHKYA